jgi:predicted HTH domain antitoxin
MPRPQDFVKARFYDSEEEIAQDACAICCARPELRIQLAVRRYQTEGIPLAKAASLAGVSWAQMKDILRERGFQPRLGPQTWEEAKAEVQILRGHFQTQP